MSPAERRSRVLGVIVVAGALCMLNAARIAPGIVGLFHDDGIYIVAGKSLAEGSGYRLSSLPTSPPQAKYPLAYPYLLSWIWWLVPAFPDNALLLKLVNVVLLFAALVSAAWLFRIHGAGGELRALLFVVLLGTNSLVVFSTRLTLSEILFLALTTAALATAGADRGRRLLPLASLAAAAYLARPAGIAAIVAIGLDRLLRGHYRRASAFGALTVLLISPWLIWQAMHRAPPASGLLGYYVAYDLRTIAYVTMWSDGEGALQVLWGNLQYLLESLDGALLLPVLPWLRPAVYLLLALGAVRSVVERRLLLPLFVVIYTAVIVGWPWHPQRFLIPLLPPLLLFVFHGAAEVESRLRAIPGGLAPVVRSLARASVAVLVVLHLAWFSLYLTNRVSAPYQQLEGRWSGFLETFAWVREHTEPDAIVASGYDPMYYLYTGRRGLRPWFYRPETYFYPYERPAPHLGAVHEIKSELARLEVGYLIIDPLDGYAEKEAATTLFARLLDSYQTATEPLFTSSDGLHRVYRLPREVAAGPGHAP